MTLRAFALLIALVASATPVLAHGADSVHSPHPECTHAVTLARMVVARRAA